MEKNNKFVIITPSYNNEEWVEPNLASMLNQTYTNWRTIYINDCSTDNTLEKVNSIVKNDKRFTIISNKKNQGATYNYINFLDQIDDNEIIIHLDGDDWLINEVVLEKLNQYYNDNDVWMTYGGFVCWDGNETKVGYPQNTEYPEFVHNYKLYRKDIWRASHLRTYKAKLFKNIDIEDFTSTIDNKLFWHASDLAWAYPCLEMCGKDKIGVVDFYTHVYNQTPDNQVRTKERESVDNSIFENEIRTKPIYKQLDSLDDYSEKLPQINTFGDNRERHTIPKLFSYCYNQSIGEFNLTILQDENILNYLENKIEIDKNKPIIAILAEGPHLFNQRAVYERIQQDYEKFDKVLGWHESLFNLPNFKFKPISEISQWSALPNELNTSQFQIYDKNKMTSFITSNKNMCAGHQFRLDCLNKIQQEKLNVDLYGRGINEIDSKLEGLKDYRFCIAMENDHANNYFTEKLLDCMLSGTIPIYHGCKNIKKYFDVNGIITFETVDELVDILNNLTAEDYKSRLSAIQKNYEIALTWWEDNDRLFEKYLKEFV